MKNATRIFASTFGAIMALAGIEHGIGEILQGNHTPEGIMILSWPESDFFRSLGGEPAMTVIPNLLVTGIIAVLISLALLVWSVLFVQRKTGGQIMMLLSIIMMLVGGGIFPPVFGIMIGAVATRIHVPVTSLGTHRSDSLQRFLKEIWPWSFSACIISWLALVPGIPILNHFIGVDDPILILIILFFALGTLLLTVFSSFAYDSQMQITTGSYNQDTDNFIVENSAKKSACV